jgi:hypothetical protein
VERYGSVFQDRLREREAISVGAVLCPEESAALDIGAGVREFGGADGGWEAERAE